MGSKAPPQALRVLRIEMDEIAVARMRPERGDEPIGKLLHHLLAEGAEGIDDQLLPGQVVFGRVDIVRDDRSAEMAQGFRSGDIADGLAVQRLGELDAFHAAKWAGAGPQNDPALARAKIDEHKIARVDAKAIEGAAQDPGRRADIFGRLLRVCPLQR